MTKPLVYLAGPIAHSSLDAMQGWRKHATARLAHHGIDTLDPLRGKSDDAITQFLNRTEFTIHTTPMAIFNRDRTDVLRADGLLVNLTYGNVASIGTMFEMAWAHLEQKPIVLVINDDIAWHRHVFIMQAAGWITTSLDEAIDVVTHIFPQGHNI